MSICLKLETYQGKVFFDVLLTVHLSVFILVINQLYAQNLFYNNLIHASTFFEHHVLIVRKSKLYYTASGIIIPAGDRPVHGTATCRFDDTRGCIIEFNLLTMSTWCSKHLEA